MSYAFGFTGEQVDAETGFVYLRTRYMDSDTGQFISRDPYKGDLKRPNSLHAYNYVGNSPTGRIDPSGRDWFDDLFEEVGEALWDGGKATATQLVPDILPDGSCVSEVLSGNPTLGNEFDAGYVATLLDATGLAFFVVGAALAMDPSASALFLGISAAFGFMAALVSCYDAGIATLECITGLALSATSSNEIKVGLRAMSWSWEIGPSGAQILKRGGLQQVYSMCQAALDCW